MIEGISAFKVVLIGGSAGSLPTIEFLLQNLPPIFNAAIIIILHRPKNMPSEMSMLFSSLSGVLVKEPEDKEVLVAGQVLLVPQNYHLLAEPDGTVSLDYSEPEQYSRPSIDISFDSFSEIYRNRSLAILLSGLNNDGAEGIGSVTRHGGQALIQDPSDCEFTFMPEAAIAANPGTSYYNIKQISTILNSIIT